MPSLNGQDKTTDNDRLETVTTGESSGNYGEVSDNNETLTADILNNGGTNTTLNVTTTATELKVGASRLADRKYIVFQALDNGITCGFTNGTQSFSAFKNQFFFMPVGENTEIWFKADTGTKQVAIGEVA